MVLRGHFSACSGKTDCNLLEREDAVETGATGRGSGLQQALPLQKRHFGLPPWLRHITFPAFPLNKLVFAMVSSLAAIAT